MTISLLRGNPAFYCFTHCILIEIPFFFLVLLEYISCRDNSITQAILINGGSSIIKLNDQLKSITHSEAKVEMGVGKSTNIHNAMMISLEVKFMF